MKMIERFTASASRPAIESGAPRKVSRRRFVQGIGGLALGVCIGPVAAATSKKKTAAAAASAFAPNAFVHIDNDNSVTLIAKHIGMGQGTYTGLATLLAEELDADWNQVRVEGAPADAKRYGNSLMGGIQGTGGSNTIANSHEQMRRAGAGAGAGAMLVSAAAARWKVDVATITVSQGVVTHAASGRKASFGELADATSRLRVPETVTLKGPKDFKLIDKQKLPRQDSAGKTDGNAIFTQDIQLSGMLIAAAAHPPCFGAKLKSFDATKAKAIAGVVDVFCAVHCGLAVNPDVIRAQMEGGIGFGLAAALHGEVTIDKGAAQQTNFHQYTVLRINEMPVIDVHIVPSADKPTGVGEPGVPPIAPAVANAIFAATGKAVRKLPIADQLRA